MSSCPQPVQGNCVPHDEPVFYSLGGSVLPGILSITCGPAGEVISVLRDALGVPVVGARLVGPPAPSASGATVISQDLATLSLIHI